MVTTGKPSTDFQIPPELWYALGEMRLNREFQNPRIRQKPTQILTSPQSLSSLDSSNCLLGLLISLLGFTTL